MTPTEPTTHPFKIGDTVWIASFESNREVKVPCRVCSGKRTVALVLGDDEIVVLPCDYCGKGQQNGPTGEETVYEPSARAQAVVVSSVISKETAEGTSYEYNWPIREDTFATEAEALARAAELAAEAITKSGHFVFALEPSDDR